MRKNILAAIVVLSAVAATPAMAGGGGGFNPGDTLSNVYQNPAAGPGFGIGSGFGLPQHRQYYASCPNEPWHGCWVRLHYRPEVAR